MSTWRGGPVHMLLLDREAAIAVQALTMNTRQASPLRVSPPPGAIKPTVGSGA